MRLEYTLSKGDWLALADHYVATAPTYQRAILTTRLVIPIACGITLLALARDRMSDLSVGGIVLGVAIVAWFVVPHSVRRSVRKYILRQTRICQEGAHVLEARTEGLYSRCAHGESTLAWVALDSVAETPTHVFVTLGEANGFAIPRGGVTSGDLPAFTALLRARLVPAAGA
jgi:hypothetical protein